MKISELSPDVRPSAGEHHSLHHLLLEDLESSIKESESLTSDDPSTLEKLSGKLRKTLSRLNPALPLPDPAKLRIWKLSYRLWNACVDLSNAVGGRATTVQAELRQICAELLLLAGSPDGIPSPAFKSASFFHRTGLIWHDLGRADLAASCFEQATDLTSSAQIDEVSRTGGEEEKRLLLDLNLARSRTAWEASDRSLAIALLSRSKNLLFGSPAAYRDLADQYLQFGKLGLSKGSTEGAPDASKLLSEALDLCEKGIAAASRGRGGETLALESLKGRCLRFLAAERLQAEDYEGVLRCVRVLRGEVAAGGGRGEEHPSVGFVAMKAWLGTGRVAEAERELRGMMANKEVAEGVCVSAAEAYLAAAGPKAASGVLMGLVGRCRAGAGAALRVLRRVAEGGGEGRVKVVAELASDERVVALFEGSAAAKERNAMHALLWNCGAEHFRSKDYQTSSEMFERSMLYVPRDEESRARRSHCFRVLGLCHLALADIDRAQEFIIEAEKLDPNIRCSFLKFKIYLQKKDEEEAIKQMQAMVSCVDFNPEYLTLSTHEAIACQSLPVAVASLTVLLNLCSPGKPTPMPEVAVLRNLITLLHRVPDPDHEILKYTRRARARMAELGARSFFGDGVTGGRERNWFAGNSWNMGLKTGNEKKHESCAEFMELASEFYGASIDDGGDGNQAMVCKSLIISVGAMINGVEERNKAPLPDSDIKKAMEMLGRAGKILPSVLTSAQLSCFGDQPAEGSTLFFLHTYSTYQLLGRIDNETTRSQQLQLIKSFAASKACTPQGLLQLGLTAAQGGRPNVEAAEFALNACRSSLLASPSPDYQMVGITFRKLVTLAGLRDAENDGAHGVYKQAYQIIVGLKDGEYPVEEGKWLAMTAWNRSGLAVRLRQVAVTRRWMKMGLDLARHLRGMEKYIGGMEECLANFEKLCGGDDGGADDKGEWQ